MRKFTSTVLATVLFFGLAAVSQAGIVFNASSAPSTGLAGFNTWTLSAISDVGAIRGVTIDVTGNLNQVYVGGAVKTPFTDLNLALGVPADNDTQFMFASGDILSLNVEDLTTNLSGSLTQLAAFNDASNSINLAQVVIPAGETFSVTGSFDETGTSTPVAVEATFGEPPMDPVLGIAYSGPGADLSAGLQGAFASNDGTSFVLADAVMATNEGDGDLDLGLISGLVTLDDDSFAQATLTDSDSNGKFDLTITVPGGFSSLDPKTAISGVVSLSSTQSGVTQTPEMAFSVAVPEPSTVALSCLALVGLVGLARRK